MRWVQLGDASFDGIFPALQNGSFDVVVSNCVIGPAPGGAQFIEVVVDEKPLRLAMYRFSRNLLLVSLVISILTAGLVYGVLPGPNLTLDPHLILTFVIPQLIYSAAVTLYLAYVGFTGGLSGILLWPAVVLHVILTALLTRASRSAKETRT